VIAQAGLGVPKRLSLILSSPMLRMMSTLGHVSPVLITMRSAGCFFLLLLGIQSIQCGIHCRCESARQVVVRAQARRTDLVGQIRSRGGFLVASQQTPSLKAEGVVCPTPWRHARRLSTLRILLSCINFWWSWHCIIILLCWSLQTRAVCYS